MLKRKARMPVKILKTKITLKDRLKMAWQAFHCKPFSEVLVGYHQVGEVYPGHECDNGCEERAAVCMSRTVIALKLEEEDHKHLCKGCAAKIEGLIAEPKKEETNEP